MKRTDLKHGLLHVKQGKTRRKIRISEEADLAAALERMQKRPRTATGVYLIQDDNGQPLTTGSSRTAIQPRASAPP
jgi:hypothetical protein